MVVWVWRRFEDFVGGAGVVVIAVVKRALRSFWDGECNGRVVWE